ncbi:hypothetical protein GGF32_002104 [Allomyces javanicus]|nr:hypothetical protein GGF32_002104 [Allomyces javanicus]
MAPPIFYGTAPPAPADSALDTARSVPAFPGAPAMDATAPAPATPCLHGEHDATAANGDDPRIAFLQPFLGKGCLPVAAKTASTPADDSPPLIIPGAKSSPSLESSSSPSPPATLPVPIPPRPRTADGTDSDESPARRKGGVSSALGSTILASPPSSVSGFAQYDLYRTGRTMTPSPPPAPVQSQSSPVPVPPAAVAARLALPTLHITRDVPATAVLSSTPASPARTAPTHIAAPRSAPPSPSPKSSASPLGSPPRRASLLRTAKVLRFPSSENVLTSPDTSPPPSPQPVPVPATLLARKPSNGRSSRDAKFVGGSYAESLLSGRLPVPASLPIVFTATVSAMGGGMAPAPVTVEFPAQFYCDGGSRTGSTCGPDVAGTSPANGGDGAKQQQQQQQQQQWSPYVGAIDLAPAVLAQQAATSSSKRRTRTVPPAAESSAPTGASPSDAPAPAPPTAKRARKRSTPSSGSSSSTDPDDPVPGGYRVPRSGQLQVIIKNPERTAVKVFLVPYNCSELSARSKTVVRVTQYAVMRADPRARSLRYALQVPLVMTRARRLYVSGAIRVVFAGSAIESYEELVTEVDRPLGVATWSPPGAAAGVAVVAAAVLEEGVESGEVGRAERQG